MLTFTELGKLGRVGNAMFQVASITGIATKHGYDYGFPEWQNYDHRERFLSLEDIHLEKYFKNPLPRIDPQLHFKEIMIDWGYHDLRLPNENLSLYGHMQSEKYFLHCEPLIRNYFDIDPGAFNDKVEISGLDKACGIHIRRGDYDNNYHPFCPYTYYEQAMSLFPANTRWVVFSDDIPKAREIIGSNAEYVSGLYYMHDLYLMTHCQDFIISNSTFSWWGAWLIKNAAKQVISPAGGNWFGPVASITGADIIPESWMQIEF